MANRCTPPITLRWCALTFLAACGGPSAPDPEETTAILATRGADCSGFPPGTTALALVGLADTIPLGRTDTAAVLNQRGERIPNCALIWRSSDSTVAPVTVGGVVTGHSVGAATITVATDRRKPLVAAATTHVVRRGWYRLSPKGAGPTNGTYSAAAPNLSSIFAAEMPDFASSTLWRFDLTTDTWSVVPTSQWPIGKYRKLLYDQGGGRLVTFWDGRGQVYAVPVTGGTWTPEGSAGNSDEYYEGFAFWNPATDRLNLFAGYGFGTFKDLLWEWNAGTNAWLGLAQSSPRPAPTFGHSASSVAVDVVGRRVFLGQRMRGPSEENYDDLWMLDLTTGGWTNLIPPATGPGTRLGHALAYVPETRRLYRFGGCPAGGLACDAIGDLSMTVPDRPPVAWTTIAPAGSGPSGRLRAGLFYDAPRRRLILVSGHSAAGWEDDVWAYYLQ